MVTTSVVLCWRRSLDMGDLQLTHQLNPGNWRLPTPSRPWNCIALTFPAHRCCPKGIASTWRELWCWDSGWHTLTDPRWSHCIRFWDSAKWMQRYTRLVVTQDKPHKWVPLLIKLAPSQSTSFFGLSLPFAYGGQFQITPRKLPSDKVTINNRKSARRREICFGKEASAECGEGLWVCPMLVDHLVSVGTPGKFQLL